MNEQSTSHWICIDEVLAYNWLSKLNHVTAVLYKPNEGELQEFGQFYGYKPERLDEPQINKLLERRVEGVSKVLLLEPRTPEVIGPLIQSIEIPFTFIKRRYPLSKSPYWNDKAVMHDFMKRNRPNLVLPGREALESQEATDYIRSLLGTYKDVVAQCVYSAGGFHTEIFNKKSFEGMISDESSLAELCKDNIHLHPEGYNSSTFLVTPYYPNAIDLCCTAVLTEDIETYQTRYPILNKLGARGTRPCTDEDLHNKSTSLVMDVASLLHEQNYHGFLNFDLLIVNGNLYLSEINFRIPQGFLHELFLREHPEVDPTWCFDEVPKKNRELHLRGPQGLGYLYTD